LVGASRYPNCRAGRSQYIRSSHNG